MAFETITAEEIDAKSPITDQLMDKYLDRDQYLKDTLTDGATAPQTITTNKVEAKSATGTGLDVTNDGVIGGNLDVGGDGQIDGNLNVTGGLTVGNFTVPDTALLFFGF